MRLRQIGVELMGFASQVIGSSRRPSSASARLGEIARLVNLKAPTAK
jgi:hypothetical protein